MKNKMIKTTGMIALVLSCCYQVYAFSDVVSTDEIHSSSIDHLSQLGIINGYEDGTFRPDFSITRAEMVQIISNMIPITNYTPTGTITINELYSDIPTSHWANDVIIRVSNLNYINGYEDGTFKPENNITYAEAIKIITNMLNYNYEADNNGGYPDGYIKIAEDIGITSGIEFDKNSYVSRKDVAVMINNALDVPHLVITSYNIDGSVILEEDENLTFSNIINNAGKQ